MDFTTQPLAGKSGQIEVIAKDSTGGDFSLVQGNAVRGGLTFTGTGCTSGQPPVALALQGGSLAGNLSARDGVVANLRTDLRSAAGQLAAGVDSAYNPGGASSDFFKIPPAAGVIALDPTLTFNTLRASATGDAGANDIALAVANVAQKQFSVAGGDSIDGTINGFFNRTVSGLGATLAGVNTRLGDQSRRVFRLKRATARSSRAHRSRAPVIAAAATRAAAWNRPCKFPRFSPAPHPLRRVFFFQRDFKSEEPRSTFRSTEAPKLDPLPATSAVSPSARHPCRRVEEAADSPSPKS